MEHSKFNLDGPAFEDSTRQVIQPDHVMPVQEEEEVMEAGVDTQLFQIPPGLPAPQEEQGKQAADALENSLLKILKCMMEDIDARDHLHAFQEFEHYSYDVYSELDCDVPEDELTDEMEDTSSDEDQLVPVSLQEEEGPTEGDHRQLSPGNIPVDNNIAIEENIEPSAANLHSTLVNVQVTEPEDLSTPSHLDEMDSDIIVIAEDQLVPMNLQEAEHFTEDDHDQSSPVIIPVEDMCSDEVELNPVNLEEEEDPTGQEDHDQPNPVIMPVEDIIAIEGNETSPVNLHLTVVSIQGTEPEDPRAPRRLDFSTATIFDSAYPEVDQKVIPENQLDVKVQTVTATSATEGDSSSSNRILLDIHVDSNTH